MGASESRSSASNQSSSSEPPRKSPPRLAPSAPTRTTSCPRSEKLPHPEVSKSPVKPSSTETQPPDMLAELRHIRSAQLSPLKAWFSCVECQPLSRTVVNEEAILNNLLSSSKSAEPPNTEGNTSVPPLASSPNLSNSSVKSSSSFPFFPSYRRFPHFPHGAFLLEERRVRLPHPVAENKSDDGCHVFQPALVPELDTVAENKSDDGKLTDGRHVLKRALDTYEIESDIQRLNEKIKGKKKTTEELERRVRWSDLRFFGRWSYLVKIQRLKENIKELKKTSEALERRVRWSDLNEIQRLKEKIKELKKTTEELERRVRWSDLRNIGLQPLRHSQSLMFLPPQMAENKSDDGKLTDGRHVLKRALDTFKIQRLKENIKELKKTTEELVAENKSDVGKVTHGRALVPELDTGILPDKYQEDAGKPAEMTVTLKYPELTAAAMAAIVGAEAAAAA